jgi:hypothetical protein
MHRSGQRSYVGRHLVAVPVRVASDWEYLQMVNGGPIVLTTLVIVLLDAARTGLREGATFFSILIPFGLWAIYCCLYAMYALFLAWMNKETLETIFLLLPISIVITDNVLTSSAILVGVTFAILSAGALVDRRYKRRGNNRK